MTEKSDEGRFVGRLQILRSETEGERCDRQRGFMWRMSGIGEARGRS